VRRLFSAWDVGRSLTLTQNLPHHFNAELGRGRDQVVAVSGVGHPANSLDFFVRAECVEMLPSLLVGVYADARQGPRNLRQSVRCDIVCIGSVFLFAHKIARGVSVFFPRSAAFFGD